jgi:hypothetical protein
MEIAASRVQAALVSALVPSPPPPEPPSQLTEELPGLSDFVGVTIYFLCFFTGISDLLESEDFQHMMRCADYEYKAAPIFSVMGLGVGFTAFSLAYAQLPEFQLGEYAHFILISVVFFLFSKHLCRMADLSRKRTNVVSAFGTLPLLFIAVIQAEAVSVKSCGFFFVLKICLAAIPVPSLFRAWRAASFDAATGKAHKRLFYLFMLLLLFVGSQTPKTSCRRRPEPTELHMTAVLTFDLLLLYIASDAMW